MIIISHSYFTKQSKEMFTALFFWKNQNKNFGFNLIFLSSLLHLIGDLLF